MMKRRLTVQEGFFCFLGAYCCAVLLQTVFTYGLGLADDAALWLSYVATGLSFVVAAFAVTVVCKVDYKEALFMKKGIPLLSVPVLIGISLCLIMLSLLLASALDWALTAIGCNITVSVPSSDTPLKIFFTFAVLALLSPLGEELMFRGVLFGSYTGRGATRAILLSALIFMLAHGSPAQTVHQFVLGIVLAYIVLVSGSVWAAVIVHVTNNVVVLALPMLFPALGGSAAFSPTLLGVYFGLAAVGAVGLILLLPLFESLSNKDKPYSVKAAFVAFAALFTSKGRADMRISLNAYLPVDAERPENEKALTALDLKKENIEIVLLISIFVVLWVVTFAGGF